MPTSPPRVIFRGRRAPMYGYAEGYHYDCLREALDTYPTWSEWSAAQRECVAKWAAAEKWTDQPREDDEPLQSLIDFADLAICQRGAEAEEWWQWLMEQKSKNFPDANLFVLPSRADSLYTTIMISDDKLSTLFKLTFGG